MKQYQYVLYFLKAIIIIQTVLIFFKRWSKEKKLFILSEALFKMSMGVFFIVFFLFAKRDVVIDVHDRIFIILAGFLILYEIDYHKVIKVFEQPVKKE